MSALGAMVHEGMSPESIDRMDIGDIVGWFQVMITYQKEVAKNAPKPSRR